MMFHEWTCFVLFLENIKQAKWFSLNESFLKSTIFYFFVLKAMKHANGFLKMALPFGILFQKLPIFEIWHHQVPMIFKWVSVFFNWAIFVVERKISSSQ